MENNKQFTNEELAKKFENNFDLVNYAISLAENMIQSGRDPRVRKTDMQNRAMLILEEIREGKDHFDEILPENYPERSGERAEASEQRFEKRSRHSPMDSDEDHRQEKRKRHAAMDADEDQRQEKRKRHVPMDLDEES